MYNFCFFYSQRVWWVVEGIQSTLYNEKEGDEGKEREEVSRMSKRRHFFYSLGRELTVTMSSYNKVVKNSSYF